MDWPTSIAITGCISSLIVGVTALFIKKKSDSSNVERREIDSHSKTELLTKIATLDANQINFEKSLNEFKVDVKDNFKSITDKIDDMKNILVKDK